jgi:hypothetical protein
LSEPENHHSPQNHQQTLTRERKRLPLTFTIVVFYYSLKSLSSVFFMFHISFCGFYCSNDSGESKKYMFHQGNLL